MTPYLGTNGVPIVAVCFLSGGETDLEEVRIIDSARLGPSDVGVRAVEVFFIAKQLGQ